MTTADTHALALDARAKASEALEKANEALQRCDRAEGAVAGLATVVNRCANEVLEVKRLASDHHRETMAAIQGAQRADAARKQADSVHEERIGKLESKLTALDLAKLALAGGGGSAVVALILGILALLSGRPLPPPAPVYGAPTVNVAPSPAPTGAPTP